jgi:hypothetical protein
VTKHQIIVLGTGDSVLSRSMAGSSASRSMPKLGMFAVRLALDSGYGRAISFRAFQTDS